MSFDCCHCRVWLGAVAPVPVPCSARGGTWRAATEWGLVEGCGTATGSCSRHQQVIMSLQSGGAAPEEGPRWSPGPLLGAAMSGNHFYELALCQGLLYILLPFVCLFISQQPCEVSTGLELSRLYHT